MATNIDTKELFEKDEYSDVIIKSGDEEVKCHRLVLCIRSKYFRTILKLDSGFIESKQTTIKLKDDRPHGVKAFLRYLYTFEYEKLYSEVLDWRYHLDVAEVADKYGEPGLEDAAWGAFEKAVNAETEIPVILSILRGLQLQDYRRDCLEEVAEHLRNKHFERLVMEKEFREMMEADMGLMWKYMERLAFAQSLVAIQAFKCKSCGHLMNDGSGKAYTCCGKRMILESFWGKQE